MQALIDADVLLHEIGWSGEFKDKETGEPVLLPPEEVIDLLDKKIRGICLDTESTEDPILFITDSQWLCDWDNRRALKRKETPRVFVPGFRYEIAKTQPYKGNRKNPKPFHFYNILAYMLAQYDTRISTDGYEADDMICIEQVSRGGGTIVCSRDKDLRICPGFHFSWECGKQGSLFPTETDRVGWLEPKLKFNEKKGEHVFDDVLGYGLSFFYYQMLVGDSADHIPGLPGWGKVKAFNLLKDLKTEEELFSTVKGLYKEVKGEESKEYFLEQANLLHMIQEKGVHYQIPKF